MDRFGFRSSCGGPKQGRLDFGLCILGSWILDFGGKSLDFPTSFAFFIRYFHVRPTQIGGLNTLAQMKAYNTVSNNKILDSCWLPFPLLTYR